MLCDCLRTVGLSTRQMISRYCCQRKGGWGGSCCLDVQVRMTQSWHEKWWGRLFGIYFTVTTMIRVFWNVKIKSIRSLQMNECQNVPSAVCTDNCWLLCPTNSNGNIRSFYTSECITPNVKCASIISFFACSYSHQCLSLFLRVTDKIFLFTWLFTGRCTGTLRGIQDVVPRIGKGIGFYHVKTTFPKLWWQDKIISCRSVLETDGGMCYCFPLMEGEVWWHLARASHWLSFCWSLGQLNIGTQHTHTHTPYMQCCRV